MLIENLQRTAERDSKRIAISYAERSLSYGEFLRDVSRCARGLRSRGIGRGDRVALVLENSPEFVTAFFAVAACGAVNVPLSPESKEEEIEFCLRDSGIGYVFVDKARANFVSAAAKKVQHAVELIDADGTQWSSAGSADAPADDTGEEATSVAADDDLIYLYSSGSTGRPKCVPRTVAQYWCETQSMVTTLQLTPADVIFCAIPLSHNYGLIECMLAAIVSGGRLVLLEKPNPFILRRRRVLELLEQERVTIFPAVPLMFKHLLDSSAPADLSRLRWCYTAAAVLPREVFDGFLDRFGVPIRQHYGCAEVGALTINQDDDPRPSAASVGQVFPNVSIRVVDESGDDVPTGQVGDVLVKGPAMTRGYLGPDEINRQGFRDGYFVTGDLGRFDDAGRLYLMGRKKFVIDVVGHKVDPVEIEDVLAKHQSVKESVAIGVRDATGDAEVVKAFVVAKRPCDENQLIAFCRERLANFKVPQSVAFISGIPRDALGKLIRKRDVLEQYVLEPNDQIAKGA